MHILQKLVFSLNAMIYCVTLTPEKYIINEQNHSVSGNNIKIIGFVTIRKCFLTFTIHLEFL